LVTSKQRYVKIYAAFTLPFVLPLQRHNTTWTLYICDFCAAVEVVLDPTEVGLVGDRGPDDKQAFVVAFFRKSSPLTTASVGQEARRRQRRAADPSSASSRTDGQSTSSKRHRYRSADRPSTAWSYHGRFFKVYRVNHGRDTAVIVATVQQLVSDTRSKNLYQKLTNTADQSMNQTAQFSSSSSLSSCGFFMWPK